MQELIVELEVLLDLLAPSRRAGFTPLPNHLGEVLLNLQEHESFLVLNRSNKALFVCMNHLYGFAKLVIKEGCLYEVELAPVELIIRWGQQLHELMERDG